MSEAENREPTLSDFEPPAMHPTLYDLARLPTIRGVKLPPDAMAALVQHAELWLEAEVPLRTWWSLDGNERAALLIARRRLRAQHLRALRAALGPDDLPALAATAAADGGRAHDLTLLERALLELRDRGEVPSEQVLSQIPDPR